MTCTGGFSLAKSLRKLDDPFSDKLHSESSYPVVSIQMAGLYGSPLGVIFLVCRPPHSISITQMKIGRCPGKVHSFKFFGEAEQIRRWSSLVSFLPIKAVFLLAFLLGSVRCLAVPQSPRWAGTVAPASECVKAKKPLV